MTSFDGIADRYDQTRALAPFRTHIEAHTVLTRLGSVHGQSWLDVACGTGYYARALRRRGADRVLGVDLSPDMLAVARSAEDAEPLGVEYAEYDAATMPRVGEFDGALGVYLLHYANSEERLRSMCRGIAANLRPGGRFLTWQLNPDLSRQPDYYLKYATELTLDSETPLTDGHPIGFRINVPGFRSPEVTAYRWTRSTLDGALALAGFERIRWIEPELSPAAEPDREFYQDYLDRPLCVAIEAVRG